MRKIYVILILLSLMAVLSFADNGWLNAQNEIQKSFNSNSPGQNLQNQLLGATNTNNNFLNLGSGVNALDSGTGGSTHELKDITINISHFGTTTTSIKFPGSRVNWTYWTEIDNWPSGMRFAFSCVKNDKLNLSIYVPQNVSPGLYSGTIFGKNPGQDNNVWGKDINLKINYSDQNYVATATSYNASFCGVTGNVLTNSSSGGVLLAELTVQSNASTITVEVFTAVNGGNLTPGISPSGLPGGMTLSYGVSNNSSYNSTSQVLTLDSQGSSQYQEGTLYVYANNSIRPWDPAGRTVVEFQFTIIPKNNY